MTSGIADGYKAAAYQIAKGVRKIVLKKIIEDSKNLFNLATSGLIQLNDVEAQNANDLMIKITSKINSQARISGGQVIVPKNL